MTAPHRDADVPALWRALGLPGLVDVHVHFLPPAMRRKVWAYFNRTRLPDGTPWPIIYREGDAAQVARLRGLGVRAFTALSYPHKPGMAAWLNAWARDFAAGVAECVPSATFFPEPGADAEVAGALEAGVRAFKAHLQVGGYDPRDPLLVPVWRRLAAAGVPVVVHAGSAPEPGPFTGPGPFGEVLDANPDLTAVIAHMGGGEYAEFLRLALRYERVHLDTTMVFTDFFNRLGPFPDDLLPVLAEHADRIVLGSDFPQIPYPYAHQLEALVRLGLGDDWLRAVCWRNGARLLGISGSAGR
ncbi:MAG: amidohydrolase [Euzebyales bacterium]|nr:amidohydrolase [Euzebyales bacterium]